MNRDAQVPGVPLAIVALAFGCCRRCKTTLSAASAVALFHGAAVPPACPGKIHDPRRAKAILKSRRNAPGRKARKGQA